MKITLADIAQKAGVAASTVYRALNNQPGVSDTKGNKIREIAAEMGYTKNYYASSLKRGQLRIAVNLPGDSAVNQFFSPYVWNGIYKYVEENPSFQIELISLPYLHAPEDLAVNLHQIADGKHGEVDGVISFGSAFDEPKQALLKLKKQKVAVINILSDSEEIFRLSCVKSDAEMTGRMAADLLLEFNRERSYSKVLLLGDFRGTNQHGNSVGFEKQVWASSSPLDIIKVSNKSTMPAQQVKDTLKHTLETIEGIGAIYCTNAVGTVPMSDAVDELGLRRKIYTIGSDVFPNSMAAVENGILTAIMHNRPARIGYASVELLIAFLLQGNIPPSHFIIPSVIVMKSNLQYYATENHVEPSAPPQPLF